MIKHQSILDSAKRFILSASGWRKIFAPSGDEEEKSSSIREEDKALITLTAAAFHRFLLEKKLSPDKCRGIVIGTDSRPTGPAIMEQLASYLLGADYRVSLLGIAAAPEIMAHTTLSEDISAFIYISASHNPIGHNGLKFGLSSGGVIGKEDSTLLITYFREMVQTPEALKKALEDSEAFTGKVSKEMLKAVYAEMASHKEAALTHYHDFAERLVSGNRGLVESRRVLSLLKREASKRKIGVIGELNGSARSLSIDAHFFQSLGLNALFFNDQAGEIVHRIVPEGESLEPAMALLEKQHSVDPAFQLAYVPDNDGDRGNIVYIDKSGKAAMLEAQEVFALALLSELSFQLYLDDPSFSPASYGDGSTAEMESDLPLAVAVNGPTSMRIDRIAETFGAKLFRAEVGEANVVNLAEKKRKEGYRVPILGEGSNGGNITHPSAVRDPLSTVMALVKLLLIRDDAHMAGLFHRWLILSGQEHLYRANFDLSDIISTLPRFTTTSAYEDRAILRLGSFSHGALKQIWEERFPEEWRSRSDYLEKQYGIVSFKIVQYEGVEERSGMGKAYRTGLEQGGLKACFVNAQGRITDCIWMRGSGTEPVFRVLADCESSDKEREAYFLSWQRDMIKQAYRRIR
jgi:phosphoglucomutase